MEPIDISIKLPPPTVPERYAFIQFSPSTPEEDDDLAASYLDGFMAVVFGQEDRPLVGTKLDLVVTEVVGQHRLDNGHLTESVTIQLRPRQET